MEFPNRLVLAMALTTPLVARGPWKYETLYSFKGTTDGARPYGGLTAGGDGVLYGTATYGGASGGGTVFELKPPAAPGGQWQQIVLHSFAGGTDGATPYGGLVLGSLGALYGTTSTGGTHNAGTIYQLAPPQSAGGDWTETILHNFGSPGDGANPQAGLIVSASGQYYGTTFSGGLSDASCFDGECGTVFTLIPPSAAGGPWTEKVLFAFPSGKSGSNPAAEILLSSSGALYGTTVYGGAVGEGVVFELKPPMQLGQPWTDAILYSFGSTIGSGWFPHGRLVVGKNGTLYGTTAGGSGSVYRLETPGYWRESNYEIPSPIGSDPYCGLMIDGNEDLLSTAFSGGFTSGNCGSLGCGSVFKVTPPPYSGGSWSGMILHTFTGQRADGAAPYAGLIQGPNGVLYGTTTAGGNFGWGTVFALRVN